MRKSSNRRKDMYLVMAIAQLKIDTEMVRIVIGVVLGGAALAFGISFGLGTRDVVRNMVAGFYARKVLEIGKNTEVAGQQGVLKAISATHTILEDEGRDISVSNQERSKRVWLTNTQIAYEPLVHP